MIWKLMPYRVATESGENNMLKKNCEPIKKTLSLMRIFLRPKPAVIKYSERQGV